MMSAQTDASNDERDTISFRTLFENFDAALAVSSSDGNVLYVNQAWADLHNCDPVDMVGRPITSCKSESPAVEELRHLIEQSHRKKSAGRPLLYNLEDRTSRQVYLRISLAPSSENSEEMVYIYQVYSLNYSDLKHGAPFFPIYESGYDLIHIAHNNRFLYVNRTWLETLGYEAAQVDDLALDDVIHPDWLTDYQQNVAGLDDEETAWLPLVCLTASGEKIMLEGELDLVNISDDGEKRAVRGIFHNVTQRVRLEEELREQRALAEALHDIANLLNSTRDMEGLLDRILMNIGRVIPHDAAAVLMLDDERQYARVWRTHGYGNYGLEEEVADVSVEIASAPELVKMAETGSPVLVSDFADDNRDSPDYAGESDFMNSYAGAPIMLEDVVIGYLTVMSTTPGFYTENHTRRLQIVTEHVATAIRNAQLYQELQQNIEQLKERNIEVNAFSHTVAHDLRAPLQVVLGYANLLTHDYADQLPEELQSGLVHIEQYALKMRNMIENLLLLSRLREDDYTIEPVNLYQTVEQALLRFTHKIQERGIEVELSPELPLALGYQPWIEEAIANYLENSIKYIGENNEAPRIKIHAKRHDEFIRLNVTDNGLGIENEHRSDVFEMFTRFHIDVANGTGLGLSIVQRIIDKLDGRVGVESEGEKGSTFWFELPAVPSEMDAEDATG